jgi:hypothetical protein
MALPTPVPGLVIRYSYLWNREYRQGRDEGQKNRPCAILAVIRADPTSDIRVVLPVTHSPPNDVDLAIEIPAKVKGRLRLGPEQSWVFLSEWNEFIWPGPDLRPVLHGGEASVAYGVLTPSFFAKIRDRFVALAEAGRANRVVRT